MFEMLENLGFEIKEKVPTYETHGFDGGGIADKKTIAYNTAAIFASHHAKSRIDAAINALGNYDESRVTEINHLKDAAQYINRKKEIEGLPPINLWSMKRKAQEDAFRWSKN